MSRLVLAIALALASLLVTPFSAVEASALWPFGDSRNRLGERTADLLAQLIQLRSVNPPGNEGPVADLVAARLMEAGIEALTIDTPQPAEGGEGRRAAAWGRLPGNGGAAPLVLLSHLDVVPADPRDWSGDPFAGEIANGYVFGRGALDAKGVTAIHVLTMIELSKREKPLERDIILLATPDEESGSRDGAGWIARERPELLHQAEFLLTEGGGVLRSGDAKRSGRGSSPPSIWGVAVTEKSPCWLELSTRGAPGHGAAPSQDAAVPRLIAALDRIRRVESPVRVLAEVESMFLALAASAPEEDRAGFATLATALDEDSAFRRRFLANPSYNALVRNTVSINFIEAGSRTNVVPGRARAQLDARLLPGELCDDFTRAIRDVVADPEVAVETLLSFTSRSSPSDTELFRAIRRVARRVERDAVVVPRMIGGFTDSHWFRDRGIVAYGFVPRWLTPEDARGIHGADERVSIENLRAGVATLIAIIEELAGG